MIIIVVAKFSWNWTTKTIFFGTKEFYRQLVPDLLFSFYPLGCHLQFLNLANNKLEDLPPEVAFLSNLREICLSCNRFEKVPSCIYGCGKLETLIAGLFWFWFWNYIIFIFQVLTTILRFHLLFKYLYQIEYRIHANDRPAAYKNIRVLWWWLIAVFAQKCPKKPQKGDFWPKKVVAYWNFRVVVA